MQSFLIAQSLDGASGHQTTQSTTDEKSVDQGNSKLYGKDNEIVEYRTDQIIIGYNSQGLPFQIVVRADFTVSNQDVFQFIHEHVKPLMADYAFDLSHNINTHANPNEDAITWDLINKIVDIKKRHGSQLKFTMSIVMVYEKNGLIKCAGFGNDETNILGTKQNGGYIYYPLFPNGRSLSASDLNSDISEWISNQGEDDEWVASPGLAVFRFTANVGDELIAYAGVPPGLYNGTAQPLVNVDKKFNEMIQTVSGGLPQRAYLVGAVSVPDHDLRRQIQMQLYTEAFLSFHPNVGEPGFSIASKAGGIDSNKATSQELATATEALVRTHNLLAARALTPELIRAYQDFARKIQEGNAGSMFIKGLGVAMMLLSTTLLGTLLTTTAVAIGAGGLFVVGVGLFAYGFHQSRKATLPKEVATFASTLKPTAMSSS